MDDDFGTDVSDVAPPKNGSKANFVSSADLWVSGKIRLRRQELGLGQQRLADDIGLSKQQLIKVEKGENRTTAGRLFDIAQALSIDPGWFFKGFPGIEDLPMPTVDVLDLLASADVIDVLRLYNRLTQAQAGAVRTIIENMVAGNDAMIQLSNVITETTE